MADSINFGLLQPPPHPTAQVMTVPNYAAENSQALSSGITAGTNAYTSMQQNNRANQLQPGLLQQQQLTNQGLTYENQVKQVQAQSAKEQWVFHEADLQAYKQGGVPAYTKSLESHDPSAAMVLKDSIESHEQLVQKGNVTDLTQASGIWNMIEASKDPVAAFKQMHDVLKRVDPKTPDNFNSRSELDAWAFGSMKTAVNYATQTQYKNQMGLEGYKIQETALQGEASDAIKGANTAAAGAANTLSSLDAYKNTLNDITTWNSKHPEAAVTVGPGSSTWLQIKQRAAAAGFPVSDLDQMEKLQAANSTMFKDAISNLKTMPRSETVLRPFQAALANPSDTIATQQVKLRLMEYSSQSKIGYADFLAKYREANGSITGAQGQWAKFLSNDPSIQNGALPDPDYVKDQDQAKPFLNKDYSAPKIKKPAQMAVPLNVAPTAAQLPAGITLDQVNTELQRRQQAGQQ